VTQKKVVMKLTVSAGKRIFFRFYFIVKRTLNLNFGNIITF